MPPDGAPRGGQDGEVYFLNYWYPQMAVYDDINGWQTDQYLGNAEFYMGYGNYDVSLTVPAGWLVTATGTLQNPAEVLTGQTRARLDSARAGHSIVHVVTDLDREPGKSTTAGTAGKLTWRYRATTVRDVAWATSARYLWDATTAAVGDANGDGKPDTSLVEAFWRPEQRANHWDESARYGQHSIEFFSKYLWPYPYPHMTAVDGPASFCWRACNALFIKLKAANNWPSSSRRTRRMRWWKSPRPTRSRASLNICSRTSGRRNSQ